MGKHILSLDIPPISNNGILLIDDTSVYDSILPVNCPTLQITYPGQVSSTLIDVTPGFRAVLNACAIGVLSGTACSTSCLDIPDGIYNIRYNIAPNDKIYVEYFHMRTTQAMNWRMELLCNLRLQCCLPDRDVMQAINDLNLILGYLDAAKATVENCHDNTRGIELYRFAWDMMDKMSRNKPFC